MRIWRLAAGRKITSQKLLPLWYMLWTAPARDTPRGLKKEQAG